MQGGGQVLRAWAGYGSNPLAGALRRLTWGPLPGLAVLMVGVACASAGAFIEQRYGSKIMIVDNISWAVLLFAAIAAWRIRSVLTRTREMLGENEPDAAFEALALPLFPAAALLVLMAPVARLTLGLPASEPSALDTNWAVALVSASADILRSALGLSATLAVVSATLCYRRDWGSALFDLGMRCFIFGIMLKITLMLLGVMTPLLVMFFGAIFKAIFSDVLPEWFGPLIEGITRDGALVIIHLSLIAGAWLAAREGFESLLESGDVDLMEMLEARLTEYGDEDK
ncbi:MAG: hypothetical protein ACI8QC_002307 [Planctomycetota bacterium]|jgi:hypothetical protein